MIVCFSIRPCSWWAPVFSRSTCRCSSWFFCTRACSSRSTSRRRSSIRAEVPANVTRRKKGIWRGQLLVSRGQAYAPKKYPKVWVWVQTFCPQKTWGLGLGLDLDANQNPSLKTQKKNKYHIKTQSKNPKEPKPKETNVFVCLGLGVFNFLSIWVLRLGLSILEISFANFE